MKLLYICHHRKHKAFRAGEFATQMVLRGNDVTLVCISESKRFGIREYLEDGVHYIEMPDLLFGRMRSGWDPWNTWNRIGYLRGKEFDLIHAFETRPATIYPVLKYLRSRAAPLVIDWNDWWGRGGLITEHRPKWYQFFLGGIETFYEEHFRTRADGTTVISRGLADRAKRLGVPPETVYCISLGSDVHRISVVPPTARRTQFGLQENAFVLGFSGLDVMSGLDMALDAVKLAVSKYPEIMLVMTGKEPPDLQKQVSARHLAENFRHFGVLPYKRYQDFLSCADAFLVPFVNIVVNHGRWPSRIRDYMAVGRPVISNPVGEMKLLVSEEEIGILADENPQDMAEKIVYLRENPEVRARLGAKARQTAEQHFSQEKITGHLVTCYQETGERWRMKGLTAKGVMS